MNLNNITTALKTGITIYQYTLFNFNVDDAIYEVPTMPREEITI